MDRYDPISIVEFRIQTWEFASSHQGTWTQHDSFDKWKKWMTCKLKMSKSI